MNLKLGRDVLISSIFKIVISASSGSVKPICIQKLSVPPASRIFKGRGISFVIFKNSLNLFLLNLFTIEFVRVLSAYLVKNFKRKALFDQNHFFYVSKFTCRYPEEINTAGIFGCIPFSLIFART